MTRIQSAALCLTLAVAPAQDPAPSAEVRKPDPQQSRSVDVRYPRDANFTLAVIDGQPLKLRELVEHIDRRHYPGFAALMQGENGKGTPAGNRLLRSEYAATWVRNLADITALRREAELRPDFDEAVVDQALAAALKESFEAYLHDYVAGLEAQGRPTTLSQDRVNKLLSDYQMRYGTRTELQGWLDYMCPQLDWSAAELRDFFQSNIRIFGGTVTLAHILVQHRDAGTGILLNDKLRARAATRISEIKERLLRGDDFATLARQFSEDTATAQEGGLLADVERFDHRLPPEICRTAWSLADGGISDVIETQYGWHIVMRLHHDQKKLMLFREAALPTVKMTRQRMNQENLLFDVRKKHGIELCF
jgi:hypothetical protein